MTRDIGPVANLGLDTVLSHCLKNSFVETTKITNCYKHQFKNWENRLTQSSLNFRLCKKKE